MTQKQAQEILPIIQAFADGKTIQREDSVCRGGWFDVDVLQETMLYPQCYRIKPEPREWWVVEVLDPCGNLQLFVAKQSTPKSIRVREVLE